MKSKVNTMFIVFITILISAFVQTVQTVPPLQVPTNYPMGSPETVTNYCVSKVTYLEVVFYRVTNNVSVWIDERTLNCTFVSKQDIDSLAKSWAQEMVTKYMITNGNQSGQFKMSTRAISAVNPFTSMFFLAYNFSFPQGRPDALPMFIDMNPKLLSHIPYHAPGVVRAILQVKGDEFMGVIDSKGSPNVIKLEAGVMKIDTRYLVDRPDWTNELTVITSNPKTFRVFDHQGVWINERAPHLRLDKTTSTLTVSNCAAGRVYQIEESTDLVQWTPTTSIFEGPYEYLGAKTNFNITTTSSSTTSAKFFRAVAKDSLLP